LFNGGFEYEREAEQLGHCDVALITLNFRDCDLTPAVTESFHAPSKYGLVDAAAQVEGPAPPGNRPEAQAATKPLDESSLPNVPVYVVLLITRYRMPRRKVELDLGHARAAVTRAHSDGQQALLVLCELIPVTELDGEMAE
jgi:hypothetical protein